jgi:signal transduction histidine kinase
VPPRSWFGAFGLRGRIVGVVVATTVLTLSVAALTLLGRLEVSLKNAAEKTLKNAVTNAGPELTRLGQVQFAYIGEQNIPRLKKTDDARIAVQASRDLATDEGELRVSFGAETTTLFRFMVAATGTGYRVVLPQGVEQESPGPYDDVPNAYFRGHAVFGFQTIAGGQFVRAAIPIYATRSDGKRGPIVAVLAVRSSILEIPGAVDAVRVAFLIAALAGLILTLLLAIPLSATVVRRLQRLRESALRLTTDGYAAEVPIDRSRDEVGDLTRTFRLMQRRLRNQEEARRAFVATASHELRTPLASLDVMLELLAEDLRSGDVDLEDAQLLLERARMQSRRLGRLAADLLDLSRIDAEVQLRSEPVELGELSRAVLAEFELGTRERGVDCILTGAEVPLWALGDPGSIARILRILLDNAVRVAPRDSEIEVLLSPGESPTLTVIDRGPGILPEERAMIFERFKRGHHTSGEAGFGLGLAIGRELAIRMGGSLVLEDSDGPGAQFTLTLPLAQPPVETALISVPS